MAAAYIETGPSSGPLQFRTGYLLILPDSILTITANIKTKKVIIDLSI
jgi:hypothetical protein